MVLPLGKARGIWASPFSARVGLRRDVVLQEVPDLRDPCNETFLSRVTLCPKDSTENPQ
jgi:hypothetical protein